MQGYVFRNISWNVYVFGNRSFLLRKFGDFFKKSSVSGNIRTFLIFRLESSVSENIRNFLQGGFF